MSNLENLMYDGSPRDFTRPTKVTLRGKEYLSEDEIRDLNSFRQEYSMQQIRELPKKIRDSKSSEKISFTSSNIEVIPNIETISPLTALVRFLEEVNDSSRTISYKAENNFFDLNLEELKQLSLEIGLYHQKLFDAEKITTNEINNNILTDIKSVEQRFNELLE